MTSPVSRGLLRRHRDFRLLFTGEVTGKYGDCVASVALPLVAVRLHATSFEIGALTAVVWLPWLVLGLPVGVLVDRLPRKPVMVAASAVSGALFTAMPMAAWCGLLTYGMLLAVAFLTGVCAVFFQSAYGAYLPSLLEPADRAEGNAKLNGSASAAQIAGLGSGGVMAAVFGAVNGLLANAATFVVSVVCLLAIRHQEPRRQAAERPGMRQQIRDGITTTFRDPWLRTGTLWGAAANFALTSSNAIAVVFLIRTVGLTAATVGLLMAVTGAGGVVGAFAVRRISGRIGSARAVLIAATAVNGLYLLTPLTSRGTGEVLYAVAGFAVSAGVVAGNILWSTFRQSYVPQHMFGRISASSSVLNYGTIPLGALAGGALASVFGLRDAMWMTTAAVPLTALILLFSPVARHRDLPDGPATDEPQARSGGVTPATA